MGKEVQYPEVLVKPCVPDFIAQRNGYRHQCDVDLYAACDEIANDLQEHVRALAVWLLAAVQEKARRRPCARRPFLHQGVGHEVIQDYRGSGTSEARDIVLPILGLYHQYR